MNEQGQRRVVPWPVSLAERMPRPGLVLGLSAGALVAILLWVTGAYDPAPTTPYWTTREQIISLAIAYPPLLGYLVGMVIFAHVRSKAVLTQLQPLLLSSAAPLTARLSHVTLAQLWCATGVGVLVGMMNIDYLTVLGLREHASPSRTDFGLAAASLAIWIVTARHVFVMIQNARLFRRIGAHHTHIDLYLPRTRRPYAQMATLYLLLVMGALAITPLQALDAHLRIENYAWAFAIGVPLAIALPWITLSGIRNAAQAAKTHELERLDAEIANAPRTLEVNAVQRLNALAQRRDYIAAQHAWPMDIRLVSRALFYIVIPPLAWVGAALVEVGIEALISR
jgi:hypothetical protein